MTTPTDELTFICPDCLQRARKVTEVYSSRTGITVWLCTCTGDHMWEIRLAPPIPRGSR